MQIDDQMKEIFCIFKILGFLLHVRYSSCLFLIFFISDSYSYIQSSFN